MSNCNTCYIEFLFPLNGDCVNKYDGKEDGYTLTIPVKVRAKSGKEIYINQQKAQENEGVYTANIPLIGYRNAILCENRTDNEQKKITVFKFDNCTQKYRFSSDDNIIFLQDITKNKDVYTSIFDNPYLAIYKKAHDLYGAKAHINLFYEFDDKARSLFSTPREYFNLSMMTDKFKEEFRANADWLKLAFHAYSEFPDKPYEYATKDKIVEDCKKVVEEIIRFAGEEVLSDSTTVHWGEGNRECIRGLRSLGIKGLTGYFDADDSGRYIVSYYLSQEEAKNLHTRDAWYDESEDTFFVKIDCVSNIGSLKSAMDKIESAVNNPHTGGFVSVMIHEQYFYPDYVNYEPDFEDRILEPCKYLTAHGYTGSHVTDIIKEPHHRKVKAFR